MADENRGSPVLKTNFLIFCLYLMLYITLRGNGEIIRREADVRVEGGVRRVHLVGAEQEIPRWRRQAYRIVFSPLMVAEEEGRALLTEGGNVVGQLGGAAR
ncbi:MAG: hypothetical protein LBU23_01145 [Planctomycetota bacterium]|jgi:hypothetical protein|nr:hypothetical protein [Planctomycetota bacterium]